MHREPHSWADDVQALVTGSLLAALALLVLREAQLVPGGTMGIALLLHRATGWNLSLALFAANAPFYLLAVATLGARFTLRTLAAVLLAGLFVEAIPHGFAFGAVAPLPGAVVGGMLCGLAMLVLFRHQASLGGLNIVVLGLQRRLGWPPALVQLLVDGVIVGAGIWQSPGLERAIASLAAVAAINFVIGINHRPHRYVAQ